MESSASPESPAPPTVRWSVQITLNGIPRRTKARTLAELVEETGVAGPRYAVMLNDAIIRKAELAGMALNDGDRVELITMVGGG